ncbi:hypothetical protein STCU_08008 [Strigomonas culicis]|uniref:Uncharacterized protein n=1 Tax=Strigomonas culicis TaxID=28005 RepID=S9V7L8_9TRYP|nr:hypothetical protein STCU_08008 [Strigomonas culicis]|eukprot:EPY22951.1 hypothetical protein STCU_08008 [Strigomonas culicis]
MDKDEVLKLANDVSSDDMTVAKEAKSKLSQLFEPTKLALLWADSATQEVVKNLLDAAESVENSDVYTLINEALVGAFDDTVTGEALLKEDKSSILSRFLFRSVVCTNLTLANAVRPAAVALVRLLLRLKKDEPYGALADEYLKSENTLRLFDCDDIESEENTTVYTYLKTYSQVIPFFVTSTVKAYEEDVVLLSNYLLICGIICRHELLPEAFLDRVKKALESSTLEFEFTCQFCAIVLRKHKENAAKLASTWVPLVFRQAEAGGDATLVAALSVLAACASTESGWSALSGTVSPDWIRKKLGGISSHQRRVSVLHLLSAFMSSPFVGDSYFSQDLIMSVWQLRRSPDETVRFAFWDVITLITAHENKKEDTHLVLFSTFLCSITSEDSVHVREKQLRVAEMLLQKENLPEESKESLKEYVKKGLYPKDSMDVADLPKE